MPEETLFWIATGVVAALGVASLALWGRISGGRQRAVDEKQAYLKGVHYLLVDDTDAAIEALTRVVEVNTETIDTYFALGVLFRRKGELERATRIHQNILLRPGISPRIEAQAHCELAEDYRASGLQEESAAAYEKAEKVAPKGWDRLPEVLEGLRDVRILQGRLEAAVEVQRRRMRLVDGDERGVLAHLLAALGARLAGEGATEEARRFLKEALKADADCVEAHLEMGRFAAKQLADRKLAQKHLERAIDLQPEVIVLAYPILADLHFEGGDFEAFGAFLQAAVGRHPDDPHLRLALARHLRARKLNDRAVEELRLALDLDPDFRAARQELGRILLEEDKGRELREQFAAILEGAPPKASDFTCARCGQPVGALLFRCPRCQAFGTIRWRAATA
ncbi:MAG: tetratricopeptide repeat protein [Deltaproteobacteria bacterium]|nr:tetratricopeptide repeat protein [Deltaproteobacteria bacterium]